MRTPVSVTLAAVVIVAGCAPRVSAPPVVATPSPALPSPSAPPTPETTPTPESVAADAPAANGGAAPLFARDVQPVLARACDPCHFPGGKMYERMPFDDPKTVASHKEGVLRRLKGADRTTLERWISAQP